MAIITLIGGARRVTLAEQIQACLGEAMDLILYSVEKSEDFYPISALANIISAPKYGTPAFDDFLYEHLKNKQSNAFACMDAAIPSLSILAGQDFGSGRIIAPSAEGAQIGLNKHLTYEFCRERDILQPRRFYTSDLASIESQEYKNIEFIAKPLLGFGGKGIFKFNAKTTLDCVNMDQNYIIQEYIDGSEVTHDLYIFENNEFISASRDRLAVIDGEVDHCIVRESSIAECALFKKIAGSGLFWGPITVQTIQRGNAIFLIEINTRLGGGVTASIQAGLPIIQAWAHESLQVQLPKRKFKCIEMKRARRDFYREI